jgi:hypothetical protein
MMNSIAGCAGSRGYVTSVNDDGLVIAKPKRKIFRRGTVRALILIAFVMLGFKAFLFARIGEAAYAERVNALAEGSVFEKAAAWAMTADPVTVALAAQVSPYL